MSSEKRSDGPLESIDMSPYEGLHELEIRLQAVASLYRRTMLPMLLLLLGYVGFWGAAAIFIWLSIGWFWALFELLITAFLLFLTVKIFGEQIIKRIERWMWHYWPEEMRLERVVEYCNIRTLSDFNYVHAQLNEWRPIIDALQTLRHPAFQLDDELVERMQEIEQIYFDHFKYLQIKMQIEDRETRKFLQGFEAEEQHCDTRESEYSELLGGWVSYRLANSKEGALVLLQEARSKAVEGIDGSLTLAQISEEIGAVSISEDLLGELDLIAKRKEARLPREPVESPEERRTKFRVLKDPEKE